MLLPCAVLRARAELWLALEEQKIQPGEYLLIARQTSPHLFLLSISHSLRITQSIIFDLRRSKQRSSRTSDIASSIMHAITATATLLSLATLSLAHGTPPPPPPPPPGYQAPPPQYKPTTTSFSVSILPITTSEPIFSILPISLSTTTCTQTICADYVNECGQWYGGCYAACPDSPKPTFTPPPCTKTTTTSKATTTSKPASKKSSTATCTQTICADYINECGQWYGGCYAACPGLPKPTFTPPPCTKTIVPITTTTTTPTSSKPGKPTSSCAQTICVDKINSCGIRYGDCYANCPDSPPPTFTTPPCPPTTTGKPTGKPATTTCTQTICVDKVNSCGLKYGGCYANCPDSPPPTFTTPPCPTTTQKSTLTFSASLPILTLTTATTSCPFLCRDYFDSCGNTFGPGCYTSCPGAKEPSYTTPFCASATTTKPAVTTTAKPKGY
ncbi:uncharacterized protein K489DRAFT_124866 [Dissoconium aciculare CBS 342.82]|uniref:Uncharacterized protein n=1 Tax=Dissoconium aciculare CBS 342.82 TaxID=1314786 RepID=A0A6J3MFG8_9PEZI|nr:uncharacterized protein K489DRAFT_124866 [Dissoconium aciculare CBS 342.82]KAF1826756.1 hypothetical protein K489DRAFT_124866 [Dissoconium aciculare CBS 342.82]